jgi:CheY-like chemotaxis protein
MPPTTTRVLLVEDEVMIRMMVADMIEELGHAVTAEADDVGRATELAQTGLFDLAILDVNLNGKLSFPAAEILVEPHSPDLRVGLRGGQFSRCLSIDAPSAKALSDRNALQGDRRGPRGRAPLAAGPASSKTRFPA